MIHYVTSVIGEERSGYINFNKYLAQSLTPSQHERLLIQNDFEGSSMFEKYNNAIESISAIHGKLSEDDYIVFAHDDVTICDPLLEEKIKIIFQNDSTLGMVGVCGTTSFPHEGGWWMGDRKSNGRGHIIQGLPDAPEFHMVDNIGYFDDVVSVDGCMFVVRGSIFNNFKFDQDTYDGYHFYDVDMSMMVQYCGWKVAVADILIKHQSEGPLGNDWHVSREKFINKWNNQGLTFPITRDQFTIGD